MHMAQVTTPYQRRAPTTAFGVADAHSYYLYVVNDEGSTKPLLVDVSGWGTTKSGATVLANQACRLRVWVRFRLRDWARAKVRVSVKSRVRVPANQATLLRCVRLCCAPQLGAQGCEAQCIC